MVNPTEIYKGKLTYTLAVIGFLWGVGGLVFGYLSNEEALATIYIALALFGLRRALPKEAN